jgi:hypothetical protein
MRISVFQNLKKEVDDTQVKEAIINNSFPTAITVNLVNPSRLELIWHSGPGVQRKFNDDPLLNAIAWLNFLVEALGQ